MRTFALFLTALAVMVLSGCSDEPTPQQQSQAALDAAAVRSDDQVKVSVAKDGTIMFDGRGAASVEIQDDKAIVAAAGVPVLGQSDSTDSSGQPKTIYQFLRKGVGAQLELSQSELVIGWVQYADGADAAKNSAENRALARRVAVATLGSAGGELVDAVAAGRPVQSGQVGGHAVSSAACVGTMCGFKISRT